MFSQVALTFGMRDIMGRYLGPQGKPPPIPAPKSNPPKRTHEPSPTPEAEAVPPKLKKTPADHQTRGPAPTPEPLNLRINKPHPDRRSPEKSPTSGPQITKTPTDCRSIGKKTTSNPTHEAPPAPKTSPTAYHPPTSPVTPTLGFTPTPEGPPQCKQQQGLASLVNDGWHNK